MIEISQNEIEKRVKDGNIILVSTGKVYDLTKFAGKHPGGRDILQDFNGKDVSHVMQDKNPHRHSNHAYRLLQQYCIGELEGDDSLRRRTNGNANETLNSNGVSESNPTFTLGYKEDMVDWNKGMVWQVGKLGAHYESWVHSPVDWDMRIFDSDFFEFFTRCPWFMIPSIWIPVVLFFLFSSFQLWTGITLPVLEVDVSSSYGLPLAFLVGLASWTLTEYAIHRFLFHLEPPATSPVLIALHFLLHGIHHKVPMDPGRLVFPPPLCALFVLVFYTVFTSVLPEAPGRAFVAGHLLGYVCYDMIHYSMHHRKLRPGSYFYTLKQYHVKHHFDERTKGFGISSKLWDIPFGTLLDM